MAALDMVYLRRKRVPRDAVHSVWSLVVSYLVALLHRGRDGKVKRRILRSARRKVNLDLSESTALAKAAFAVEPRLGAFPTR